jgi:hypothetical protein
MPEVVIIHGIQKMVIPYIPRPDLVLRDALGAVEILIPLIFFGS